MFLHQIGSHVSKARPGAPVSLEIYLQAELQDAGRIGCGDLSKERTVSRRNRTEQVGMVEAVETLAAKFQLHGLRQGEEPADGAIDIGIGRAHDRVWLGVAVGASPARSKASLESP